MNLTGTFVTSAAFNLNNSDDSLLLKKAFIFAQALKSELYREVSSKLFEIEKRK